MARGPLPNAQRRRRNAPTIPTTDLPASGFAGKAPAIPKTRDLGNAGRRFWTWAWKTPQAAAWDAGAAELVARRAQLEDDLDYLGSYNAGLDLDDLKLLGDNYAELAKAIKRVVRDLQALATGKLAVLREMRELDDRLGLSPKALAQLRWTIVDDRKGDESDSDAEPDELERRRVDRKARRAAQA